MVGVPHIGTFKISLVPCRAARKAANDAGPSNSIVTVVAENATVALTTIACLPKACSVE